MGEQIRFVTGLSHFFVIPAQAGIRAKSRVRGDTGYSALPRVKLDSRLRGNEDEMIVVARLYSP